MSRIDLLNGDIRQQTGGLLAADVAFENVASGSTYRHLSRQGKLGWEGCDNNGPDANNTRTSKSLKRPKSSQPS